MDIRDLEQQILESDTYEELHEQFGYHMRNTANHLVNKSVYDSFAKLYDTFSEIVGSRERIPSASFLECEIEDNERFTSEISHLLFEKGVYREKSTYFLTMTRVLLSENRYSDDFLEFNDEEMISYAVLRDFVAKTYKILY